MNTLDALKTAHGIMSTASFSRLLRKSRALDMLISPFVFCVGDYNGGTWKIAMSYSPISPQFVFGGLLRLQ